MTVEDILKYCKEQIAECEIDIETDVVDYYEGYKAALEDVLIEIKSITNLKDIIAYCEEQIKNHPSLCCDDSRCEYSQEGGYRGALKVLLDYILKKEQ